jgi:hypothetical protein
MIGKFDVVSWGWRNHRGFGDYVISENETHWKHAARQAAAYAKTNWFWLLNDADQIKSKGELEKFVPEHPTISQTRQYVFQPLEYSDRYVSEWGPLRLFHKQAVLNDEALGSKTVFTAGLTFPKYGHFPVFFVSNGEKNAEVNWLRLKSLYPEAKWVKNVQGRKNMFLACSLRAQYDSHFWVVTGKNYVTDPDVFNFYPDILQPDHHWIFQSKNASNGLEYGHMGIGLYSAHSVHTTPDDFGLDFTMASPFHSIPWTVSEGRFATSPWEAFRTAYRESFKLTRRIIMTKDPIASQRLDTWVRGNIGEYWENVRAGALQGSAHGILNYPGKVTVEWKDLESNFERHDLSTASMPVQVHPMIMELCSIR